MSFIDFLFSYKTIIKSHLLKKKYFQAFRKSINFPYKFLLNQMRIYFKIRKTNLDNYEKLCNKKIDDLFIHFNSDKGSKVQILGKTQEGHYYSSHYEKYFSKFKKKENIRILEIGSLIGASAASFLNYFENAKICCLDINPFNMNYYSNKIRPIYIDTQSKIIIKDVENYINSDFDIIIDDGSHNKKDQILTLNSFFSKLKKNGIYVIEDTYQYLEIPTLNDDKLDYGVNEFIESVQKTGTHLTTYLNLEEKKKIQLGIKKIFFEKGNFVYKNQSLKEIIFIEKN
jgi:predicted O-methyltransferase YrrM